MEKNYKLLYPMRVCLISASHNKKDNFMPAAWVYPVSASPELFAVAISKKRYTYGLIRSSGYFVINIPGFDLKHKLELFGKSTGRDGDKFSLWGLTKEKCSAIPSISIAETLLSMECKLVNEIEAGDHILFIGELVHLKTRKYGQGIFQATDGYVGL